MASKQDLKTNIVKEYLQKFPNSPDLTLAKAIYKKNSVLFLSVENARNIVRYHRGHSGSENRKRLSNKDHIKPVTYNTNPFKMPTSYARKRTDYILPNFSNNILLLSDIHLPYHDTDAIDSALQYGLDNNINTIFLNGDILDCYQASFHEKDPRKRSLADEFEAAREFFQYLRGLFPKATIYYHEGNHEARLKRYLQVKAPELLGCEEFELPVLLKLKEYKIEWIDNINAIKAGKLFIMHGNQFKGGGGVNPARAYYLRSKVSLIAGDKHQTSEHTESSLNADIVTCWSTGCLCELSPEYMPYNRWNLGFAHIKVSPDKTFQVFNKRIINGKIV